MVYISDDCGSPSQGSSLCLSGRQRAELEDLRRQLEENSSLAGRALREELDKTREEQERRHQVTSIRHNISVRNYRLTRVCLVSVNIIRKISGSKITECCFCNQVEMKSLQERLDIEKQTWEENYKKKEVC